MSSESEDEDLLFHRGNNNERRSSSPRLIYVLTGLAAISGFLFGYDTGVVSGSMILVRKDLNLNNIWHELIVSSTVGSACLFSLITGSLMDRLGRKVAILLASTAFTLGSLVMAAAPGKELLLCGRLIVGVGVGLGSATVPVYISECSPPSRRGVLVTLNNMAITGGQLVAGVVCGLFSQSVNGWRYMIGIASVPAILQLCGFLLMPESPRFLVKKEKYGEAQKVLSSIRSPYHQIQDELEDIKISCTSSETLGFFECLKSMIASPTARKSLFIGCLLQFVQQIAGINTVMYYAASVLTMAGANSSQAIWLSATTACVNFLFTLVGIYLVAKWTRRRLLLTSLLSVIFALLLISVSFKVIDSSSSNSTVAATSELPIIATTIAATSELPIIATNNSTVAATSELPIISTDNQIGHITKRFDITTEPTIKSSDNRTVNLTESFTTSSDIVTDLPIQNIPSSTPEESSSLALGTNPVLAPLGAGPVMAPLGAGPVMALISMCIYLAAFAPGMGPLPWTINSEMHPPRCRAQAASLATATNWIANLLVSLTFLSLTSYLGRSATFLVYAVCSLLGFILLYFNLPETKGVPLEQVEQLFQSGSRSASHRTVAYSRIEPSP